MAIYKMKNTVRHYPWGDTEFLPEMLGLSNKENQPFAELWMGSHPSAPSEIVINGQDTSLLDALKLQEKNSLPFLFKVLCAASPLSLQVHPDKKHAEKMFTEENAQGIAPDAFTRNYKDNNHKPEILCALTPFQAMRGFRPISEILMFFTPFSTKMPDHFLIILKKMEERKSVSDKNNYILKEFFTTLYSLSSGEKEELIVSALKKITETPSQSTNNPAHFWVKRLSTLYPGDIGILSPYFLNVIQLNPGEAIFLDAGYIHSYLKGSGIELMANSDNVLRCGLTPKNVDIPELIKVVQFESEKPTLVSTQKIEEPWIQYITPVKDFTLFKAKGKFNTLLPGSEDRIVLVTKGTVSLQEKDGPIIKAIKGESLFITNEKEKRSRKISLSGNGTVFLASAGD